MAKKYYCEIHDRELENSEISWREETYESPGLMKSPRYRVPYCRAHGVRIFKR
jgi:hypothetical protein